jgi:RHS repeat-associated protein
MSEATNGNSFPVYALFDSFGNRYSGVTTPGNWSEYGWGGQWGYQTEADLGLVYMEQRYYDPTLGRFISADPLGFEAGLNLYSYTGNDPVDAVDPTGLQEDPVSRMILHRMVEQGVIDYAGTQQPLVKGVPETRASGSGGRAAGSPESAPVKKLFTPPKLTPVGRREGAQARGRAAEVAVSLETGLPLNNGQNRVSIPGTGPGGKRYPEFDPKLSIPKTGTIIELKGQLTRPVTMRRQIRDLLAEARVHRVPLAIYTDAPVSESIWEQFKNGAIRLFVIPWWRLNR